MTSALTHYLAAGGDAYLSSDTYEQRRLALAEKMKHGPVSIADMAATLKLPVPVVVALFNAWRLEVEAKQETKH